MLQAHTHIYTHTSTQPDTYTQRDANSHTHTHAHDVGVVYSHVFRKEIASQITMLGEQVYGVDSVSAHPTLHKTAAPPEHCINRALCARAFHAVRERAHPNGGVEMEDFVCALANYLDRRCALSRIELTLLDNDRARGKHQTCLQHAGMHTIRIQMLSKKMEFPRWSCSAFLHTHRARHFPAINTPSSYTNGNINARKIMYLS